MSKTCDFRDPGAKKVCGAEAAWIADVDRTLEPDPAAAYTGTSWNVSLCEKHYEELRTAGRITGTAHKVADASG